IAGRPGYVLTVAPGLSRVAPFHDDLEGTANADEQCRQSRETAGAIHEYVPWTRIPVVVSHIGCHVQAQPAVRGDRLVHRCVRQLDERFEIRPFASGPQTYARAVAMWR